MENRFRPGDIVQHFKRELLDDEERKTNKYLYEIIGVATHSETREPMMVYRPLYDDGGMYVRPLEMFLSEVDHEKYPGVKQRYRFEKALLFRQATVEDIDGIKARMQTIGTFDFGSNHYYLMGIRTNSKDD